MNPEDIEHASVRYRRKPSLAAVVPPERGAQKQFLQYARLNQQLGPCRYGLGQGGSVPLWVKNGEISSFEDAGGVVRGT